MNRATGLKLIVLNSVSQMTGENFSKELQLVLYRLQQQQDWLKQLQNQYLGQA